MNLARHLFLNCEPFNNWSDDVKVRCYFWDQLQEFEPHQTIFAWEKSKYINVVSNKFLSLNMNDIEQSARKLREVIKKYFELGPREIQEFFYSYDKK